MVKVMFKGVLLQYKGRPSKVTENWTKSVMLRKNFCHNLKGFPSKGNIIAPSR